MKKFNKYAFKKYDKKFIELYKQEKMRLLNILPKKISLEHIGSTAVSGLGGKGIIDIIIGVNKSQTKSIKNKLIKFKYRFYGDSPEGNERLFFEKDYKINRGIKRFHIQLTWRNSKIWKNALKFRDILRGNPEIVREYERIKKKAVKFAKGEGARYRAYKAKFIQNLIKEKK